MSTQALGCSQGSGPPPPPAKSAPAAPQTLPVPASPLVVGAQLERTHPHPPSFDGGAAEFIHESMDDLYPIFCEYRSMSQGDKAGLWAKKYYGKWVRWTGRLRAFTKDGIAVAQKPGTVTFDVSLWVDDRADLAVLAQTYHPNDRITYIGRLDSYDDVFQKLYLSHGAILEHADPRPAHRPPDLGQP